MWLYLNLARLATNLCIWLLLVELMSESSESDTLTKIESRIPLYWRLAAVAVFLLVPIDMVTTMFAAYVYGSGAEANWIVAHAIEEGPVVFAGINLIGGFLVSLIFYGLIELIESSPHEHQRALGLAFEAWVTILIGIGLFVAANNISVIVLGQSLV